MKYLGNQVETTTRWRVSDAEIKKNAPGTENQNTHIALTIVYAYSLELKNVGRTLARVTRVHL